VGDRDVDLVRINSEAAGVLELDIDSYSIVDNLVPVDTVLVLFDAEGNWLGVDDGHDELDPFLQIEVAANTDYFVATVGHGNGTDFDPFLTGSGSSGDTGDYRLSAHLLPLSARSELSDDLLGNKAIQDLAIDTEVVAYIGWDDPFVRGAGDVDLFRFTAPDSGWIEIRAGVGPFGADTFLRVFGADGTEIAFNDDMSGASGDSLLRVHVTAGQEYFVGINGRSDRAGRYNPLTGVGAAAGSQGAYLLSVSSTLSDVPPTVDIVDVSPDPRRSLVEQITIVFNEPVNGLDLSNLALTRDAGTNLLPGGATISTSDNRIWTVDGLGLLTDRPGTYEFTISATGSGIKGFTGQALAAGGRDAWTDVRRAGDVNGDGQFDQLDIVAVLVADKYLSGDAATWSEGDFDGDGVFDQRDLVAALQTGMYLNGL
jgi:hypothetical protein